MQQLPGPILAIESATATARIVLTDGAGRSLSAGQRVAARHSGILLPLVEEVLGQAGVRPVELYAIAVDAGPGSFTGLRVGLAAAKGMCLATSARLVLVPSLQALALDLAATAPSGAALVPCLDAGKGEVYAAIYRATADGLVQRDGDELRVTPPGLLDPLRNVAPAVLGGTGVGRFPELLEAARPFLATPPSVEGPTAASVARLAIARLLRGEEDDLEKAVPSYGRPPDITKPKPKPRTP